MAGSRKHRGPSLWKASAKDVWRNYRYSAARLTQARSVSGTLMSNDKNFKTSQDMFDYVPTLYTVIASYRIEFHKTTSTCGVRGLGSGGGHGWWGSGGVGVRRGGGWGSRVFRWGF